MNRKRPSSRELESLRAEPSPEDGADPREFFRPSRERDRFDRKTMQLCSQISDTLSQILSGESGDEVLRELQVVSVTPAPDASQLLVIVAPAFAADIDERLAMARLGLASSHLRAEVSAAITRRRAPKLMFRFVARPSEPERERTR